MQTTEQIRIDATIEPKIREWLDSGRGLLRWENLEIGSSQAQHVFTPARTESGAPMDKPGWRYGNPVELSADDLCIVDVQTLETFKAGLKRHYWGLWLSDASEAKAERILAKWRITHPGAVRHWEFDDDGKPVVTIGVEIRKDWNGNPA